MSDASQADAVRTALSQAAHALAHGLTLDATLSEMATALVGAVGATSSAVIIADADRSDLDVAAAAGYDAAALAALVEALGDSAHPLVAAAGGGAPTWGGETAIPLTVSVDGAETVIGAVSVTWADTSPPDAATRGVVEAFRDLLAVAIDRSRLGSMASERSEWFERMAHLDPLTGLTNSRTFARVLELELVRAGRQGGEVALAVFDVDDFRAANEAGGHAVGDDILRSVAAVIAESVRLVDTVARYGGDEFIVVAPGAGGGAVARRILDAVAALPMVADRSISVSAGIARFPADGSTSEDLLAAAEQALAGAKAGGQASIAEASILPTG
ncbi:MAG: GGDEF domain-containing protein [Chloroflexota bacterium]